MREDADFHTTSIHLRDSPFANVEHLKMEVGRRLLLIRSIAGIGQSEVFLERDFASHGCRCLTHINFCVERLLCLTDTCKYSCACEKSHPAFKKTTSRNPTLRSECRHLASFASCQSARNFILDSHRLARSQQPFMEISHSPN